MALVAILAALAAPSMQLMLARKAVAAHSETLASALRLARSEAQKRSQAVSLCPSSDASTCTSGATWNDGWVVFIDRNGDGVKDSNDTLMTVQQGSGHVGNLTETSAATRVTFLASGIVADARTFLVRPGIDSASSEYDASSRRVELLKAGRPRVLEGAS